MDLAKFKATEEKYRILKEQLDKGELTPEQMKQELKKMMVLDEKGYYWMIGGKSGNWYVYNGTDWQEESPFKKFAQEQEEEVVPEPQPEPRVETARESASEFQLESGAVTESQEDTETKPLTFKVSQDELRREHEQEQKQEQEKDEENPFQIERGEAVQEAQQETVLLEDEPVFGGERKEPVVEEAREEEELVVERAEPEVSVSSRPTVIEEKIGPQVSCPVCQSKIPVYAVYCQVCGANQKHPEKAVKSPAPAAVGAAVQREEIVITAIKVWSLVFFLGGVGMIAGVLFGAAFGVFKSVQLPLEITIPAVLTATRGGVAGGLFFAAGGGFAGFVAAALGAFFASGVYNFIAWIFGGIRFKIKS